MAKGRLEARKAVVFNLANEADARLHEYANEVNFSRLVKKYLEADLLRKSPWSQATLVVRHGDEQ